MPTTEQLSTNALPKVPEGPKAPEATCDRRQVDA